MSSKWIRYIVIPAFIILALHLVLLNIVQAEPTTLDSHFTIQRIFAGKFEPSSMTFLGPDDILLLDRDNGKVYRITNGIASGPLLDVNVATDGYRGLLGIAATNNTNATSTVLLYFTEAHKRDGDDGTNNTLSPLGNMLYSYNLVNNKLINPKLLLDLPALPGPRHAGGVVDIGPDKNIYLTIGDLDGTFRYKQYETKTQNFQDGVPPDGRSGILVVTLDGKPAAKQILGNSYPINLYYAYGIRNSFGIDWDPLTGNLWDSENGPTFGDELNLVLPGFNSGWARVQGFWQPNLENKGPTNFNPNDLESFGGRGTYSPPKFVWLNTVAPSAIKFLDTEKYGTEYNNDLLVGDANYGNIYDFNLDKQRTNLILTGKLSDKIADNINEINHITFAKGFGKVTDMEIDPNGYLYVLSSQKHLAIIYRILPS